MTLSAASALSAYRQTQSRPIDDIPGLGAGAAAKGGGASFADMLSQAAEGAVAASRQAETTGTAALMGRADLNQVVTAVAEAEVTLQTVVAIRDRLVGAYQEIMRMPI